MSFIKNVLLLNVNTIETREKFIKLYPTLLCTNTYIHPSSKCLIRVQAYIRRFLLC